MKVSRPKTVKQAVEVFGREKNPLVVAGGTDVMVLWNIGQLNGRSVIDISLIEDWKKISSKREGLVLGALATHTQIRRHKAVLAGFPLLARACATIGAIQIQNRGTIGGNLANASPAGDTFPPLAVYEPVVHTVSPRGERQLSLTELFAGVKRTNLGPGELIAAVELRNPARKPDRQYFRKVGTRAAQAISKTVGAGLLWLNKDKTVAELRFALGSVAPTVRRLRSAEAVVAGRRLDAATIDEACRLVEEDISPIDDIRSTRDYRLAVSRNMLREFLEGRNS